MFGRTGIILLAAAAALAAADKPNRDIQELQRDVAQLQEMVKTLQQSLDQRTTALTGAIQGVAGAVEKINASVATVQKQIDAESAKVVPAVTAQGTRIDQTSQTLATVQQAVADLTAAVNRLQTQLGDIGLAVKSLAATPVAPPGSDKPSAADLINNATGDQSGGKPQLALQEYTDYLKYYGDTPMAHIAQFQIGVLHYQLKDYDAALQDFDTLEQKFPDSSRIPDALFYKRQTLHAMGRTQDAAAACQELRKRFPTHDLAKQCITAKR